jgi:hypothetical protein
VVDWVVRRVCKGEMGDLEVFDCYGIYL